MSREADIIENPLWRTVFLMAKIRDGKVRKKEKFEKSTSKSVKILRSPQNFAGLPLFEHQIT